VTQHTNPWRKFEYAPFDKQVSGEQYARRMQWFYSSTFRRACYSTDLEFDLHNTGIDRFDVGMG